MGIKYCGQFISQLGTWMQKRPGILFSGFISIIHKWSKDTNNKNKDLKAKIYYMALKIML